MLPAPPPLRVAHANANGLVGGGSGGTEGGRGLLCGILFGLTSPLVGHPLDSIKTRMQADAAYYKGSALRTLTGVARAEGFLALYRGLLPPLIGSTIFRSVQISVYAGVYAAAGDSPALRSELPGTAGLQARVLVAAVASSTARALIESPLELVKVRQQTGQRWLAAPSARSASYSDPRAAISSAGAGTGSVLGRRSVMSRLPHLIGEAGCGDPRDATTVEFVATPEAS